jgi:hypothetical protein
MDMIVIQRLADVNYDVVCVHGFLLVASRVIRGRLGRSPPGLLRSLGASTSMQGYAINRGPDARS